MIKDNFLMRQESHLKHDSLILQVVIVIIIIMTISIPTIMNVVVAETEIVVAGMAVAVDADVGVDDITIREITEDVAPHPRHQVLAPLAPHLRIQARPESLRLPTQVLLD